MQMMTGQVSRTLWSRGKLERVEACPACGSRQRQGEPFVCSDHRTDLRDERWEMHRCAGCASLFLDPRPDAESLPRAYESYYTHATDEENPPTSGIGGWVWRAIHGYLNRRFGLDRQPAAPWGYWLFWLVPPLRLKLDYYGRHLFADRFPKRGRLLDVGCGNGAFLARAREMGWTVTGLEPDGKAVAACQSQGLEVVQGDVTLAPPAWKDAFDVITMSHAIEHVADPAADLARMFGMLKPGGFLWLALPNPQSFGARLFREAWRELHPPYHMCIVSQPRLKELLQERGFSSTRALRVGARNARALRESMENAQAMGLPSSKFHKVGMQMVRFASDALTSVCSRYSEETVIIASRPD
jgi:2-polyprenyl-3-methyl-5-hydroxy-6-metoxy-1,4-benzoquinol methylase